MNFPIALEIGDRFLKLTAVKVVKKNRTMKFFVVPVPGAGDEEISKAIKDIVKKSKLKVPAVFLSMPRNLVTMKRPPLPAGSGADTAQQPDPNTGADTPGENGGISFGLLPAGYAAPMLAMVSNDILKRYQKILKSTGLRADRAILSSYGVWHRAVRKFGPDLKEDGVYVLLDVDSSFTDLIVFNKDGILFSKAISFEPRSALTREDLDGFVKEIKLSLSEFGKSTPVSVKPSRIFVSGALEENVVAAVKKGFDVLVLKVPAPEADSLEGKASPLPAGVSISAVSELASQKSPEGISFLFPGAPAKELASKRRHELAIFAILSLYLLTVATGFFWTRQYSERFYLKRLVSRTGLVERDAGVLPEQHRKARFVKDFLYGRKAPLLLIGELEKAVPADMALDYISLGRDGSVSIGGYGQSAAITKFLASLEKSRYFIDFSDRHDSTVKVKDKVLPGFQINFTIALPGKRPQAEPSSGLLAREIALEEARLSDALSIQGREGRIRSEYASLAPYIENVKDISEKEAFAGLLREVRRAARGAGLSILSLIPAERARISSGAAEYSAELRSEGSLEKGVNFIKRIQESKTLMKIENLAISSKGEKARTLKIEATISFCVYTPPR